MNQNTSKAERGMMLMPKANASAYMMSTTTASARHDRTITRMSM